MNEHVGCKPNTWYATFRSTEEELLMVRMLQWKFSALIWDMQCYATFTFCDLGFVWNLPSNVKSICLNHVIGIWYFFWLVQLGVLRKVAKRENDIRVYADELGMGLAGELDFTLEAANALEFQVLAIRFKKTWYF